MSDIGRQGHAKLSAAYPLSVSRCTMKIASPAEARITRLFLEVSMKATERSVESALSLERETYVRQEAKVLSLDGTESEELVLDRSFLLMRYVFCFFPVLHLQVPIERCF